MKIVRYQLKRTNETTKETVTFDITNLDGTGLLDEGLNYSRNDFDL